MRSEITKLAKGLSGSIAQLLDLADINLVSYPEDKGFLTVPTDDVAQYPSRIFPSGDATTLTSRSPPQICPTPNFPSMLMTMSPLRSMAIDSL
ncbi:hypothetical protein [Halalkalicoccus salilacus]|uniref:hypothetical protein n=1 Tax=Halalkalicoccus TaxID=332246 RepID=UPI002F96929F